VSLQIDVRIAALKKFILAEILLLISVIMLFKFLDSQVAGTIAGMGFLILGLLILYFTTRLATPWNSLLRWAALLYLFGSVLPILTGRLMNWGTEFRDILIFGISGPQFHRISEILYLLLIGATVFELLKLKRAARSATR
jgi:hypothetical protein